jgi:hypothetical protein
MRARQGHAPRGIQKQPPGGRIFAQAQTIKPQHATTSVETHVVSAHENMLDF